MCIHVSSAAIILFFMRIYLNFVFFFVFQKEHNACLSICAVSTAMCAFFPLILDLMQLICDDGDFSTLFSDDECYAVCVVDL
jgi:hypothetical protein